MEQLLYTIAESGAVLGHGRSWAYAEVRAGRLRTVRVNRREMVTADELRRYVAVLEEASVAA